MSSSVSADVSNSLLYPAARRGAMCRDFKLTVVTRDLCIMTTCKIQSISTGVSASFVVNSRLPHVALRGRLKTHCCSKVLVSCNVYDIVYLRRRLACNYVFSGQCLSV